MFCIKCGSQMEENQKFCTKCGADQDGSGVGDDIGRCVANSDKPYDMLILISAIVTIIGTFLPAYHFLGESISSS